MSPYLPGHPPKASTSFIPPALQILLGLALLGLAWWAYLEAQTTRATDAWLYNALSAITGLAGLLWLPFAVGALGAVIRNRRRHEGARLR